ncbi:TPA: acetyl-CoA carboxylase carboxyl transferase subunit beta [bacterium]|nr:acetyl-CoA carboxylase carboxyl transferase subunit beta [bacterium]
MNWFRKPKYTTLTVSPPQIKPPSNIWVKCDGCGELIYKNELENNFMVCIKCNFHFRLSAKERIKITLDKGSFKEDFTEIHPVDFLGFYDTKGYNERLIEASKNTGCSDAIVCGYGKIDKKPVAIGVMDFSFMGGSMGSVVGEKITLLVEKATESKIPLIIFSSSGGARIQEGMVSLIQMAKTSGAISYFKKNGGFYLSALTDPTTGGVAASFALLGDIIIAEPKALIGFAGPRVIEQTIRQHLPSGFQTSEFLLSHGIIDMVVERKNLKKTISSLLTFFS